MTVIPFVPRDKLTGFVQTEADKYEAALEVQARQQDPESWALLDDLFKFSVNPEKALEWHNEIWEDAYKGDD